MLETQSLLLRNLQDAQGARVSRSVAWISIVDVASGTALGSVHSCGARRPWSRWLAPTAWDVFETDDLSHVFSLRRTWPWSPEWTVHDAEGHGVGSVLTRPARLADLRLFLSDVRRPNFDRLAETRIEDHQGRCVARVQDNGDTCFFLSISGTKLGCLSRRGEESELTFAAVTTQSPFLRMLLLAAALVRG
jgi:hypothetical protein